MSNFVLPDRVYDFCSWLAAVVIPALILFYTALGQLWGWPKTTEVAGTLAAVEGLLGALVKKASADYNREPVEH